MTNELLKSIRDQIQREVATSSGGEMTTALKTSAGKYLASARNEVILAAEGLTKAQLQFKFSPDRWSIAEIVEHLAAVEEGIVNRVMAPFATAQAAPPDRPVKEAASRVLTQCAEVVEKWSASARVHPTGGVSLGDSLTKIKELGVKSRSFLNTFPDLRKHVLPHPFLGPLDGFDWVLLVAAHYERHLGQINGVKAEKGFPPVG